MDREEIKDIRDVLKMSSDNNYECRLSTKDSARLITYVTQLESERDKYKADAVEMAKLSLSEWITVAQNKTTGKIQDAYCQHCGRTLGLGHKDNCEVLEKTNKAEQLLSDKKQSCDNCGDSSDCYHWDSKCKETKEGIYDLSHWVSDNKHTDSDTLSEREKQLVKYYKNDCGHFLARDGGMSLKDSKDIIDTWLSDKEWLQIIDDDVDPEDYIEQEIENWNQ